MDMQNGEEAPPKSTDLVGWREAIAADRLKVFRLEALAAAFQDLGNRDTQVQHALAKPSERRVGHHSPHPPSYFYGVAQSEIRGRSRSARGVRAACIVSREGRNSRRAA
jgi:hypothetical protein